MNYLLSIKPSYLPCGLEPLKVFCGSDFVNETNDTGWLKINFWHLYVGQDSLYFVPCLSVNRYTGEPFHRTLNTHIEELSKLVGLEPNNIAFFLHDKEVSYEEEYDDKDLYNDSRGLYEHKGHFHSPFIQVYREPKVYLFQHTDSFFRKLRQEISTPEEFIRFLEESIAVR